MYNSSPDALLEYRIVSKHLPRQIHTGITYVVYSLPTYAFWTDVSVSAYRNMQKT